MARNLAKNRRDKEDVRDGQSVRCRRRYVRDGAAEAIQLERPFLRGNGEIKGFRIGFPSGSALEEVVACRAPEMVGVHFSCDRRKCPAIFQKSEPGSMPEKGSLFHGNRGRGAISMVTARKRPVRGAFATPYLFLPMVSLASTRSTHFASETSNFAIVEGPRTSNLSGAPTGSSFSPILSLNAAPGRSIAKTG